MNCKSFSLKEDGEKFLDASKFLQVKEFRCKDGSDPIFINPELVTALLMVRCYFMGKYPKKNIQLLIVPWHSGYRSTAHNTSVGGVSNSQHIYGNACDFSVNQVPAKEVQEVCEMLWSDTYGIGKATDYTHLDVRSTKARWTY